MKWIEVGRSYQNEVVLAARLLGSDVVLVNYVSGGGQRKSGDKKKQRKEQISGRIHGKEAIFRANKTEEVRVWCCLVWTVGKKCRQNTGNGQGEISSTPSLLCLFLPPLLSST